MSTDLSTLRTRAQVLYDVAGTLVLTPDEWTFLLNDAYRKLWRTVVRINKFFRVNIDPFALASTSQTRVLPSDYRETVMVRENPGTETQNILDRMTPRIAAQSWEKSYRLQGTNLYIEPLQRCAGTYDHLYIPQVTELVEEDDTLDAELDQFSAFITYDAANIALAREESSQVYLDEFAKEEQAVIAWASSQRSAEPDRVEDVRHYASWQVVGVR